MQVLRVWAITSALMLTAACGSSDDSNDGNGSTPALDPPPNIDALVCSNVTMPEDTISVECSDCCTSNGFSGSTEYAGRCVCGNSLDDTGETACADQTATADLCTGCCDQAGFTGYSWFGDLACTCFGRSNGEICAQSLQSSQPEQACRVCCLNSGYLGTSYVGIGRPECRCTEL